MQIYCKIDDDDDDDVIMFHNYIVICRIPITIIHVKQNTSIRIY